MSKGCQHGGRIDARTHPESMPKLVGIKKGTTLTTMYFRWVKSSKSIILPSKNKALCANKKFIKKQTNMRPESLLKSMKKQDELHARNSDAKNNRNSYFLIIFCWYTYIITYFDIFPYITSFFVFILIFPYFFIYSYIFQYFFIYSYIFPYFQYFSLYFHKFSWFSLSLSLYIYIYMYVYIYIYIIIHIDVWLFLNWF